MLDESKRIAVKWITTALVYLFTNEKIQINME